MFMHSWFLTVRPRLNMVFYQFVRLHGAWLPLEQARFTNA